MNPWTRAVALAALASAAAGGVYLYQQRPAGSGSAPPARSAGARPVPVTIAAVETGRIPVTLTAIGRAEALASVTLRARADGQVVATHYSPGSAVRKGQVMVRLDSRAVEAQVRQAEANLARDRAQLDKARSDLARYTDLLAKGFVSAAQLETYRATVDSLDATVRADIASLDLLRVQLSYLTVEAPMDGVAGAALVFPGGAVKANDTPLVVVNQVRPLYVTFSVPETRLGEVGRERLGERLRVEARVAGKDSAAHVGELAFVDNAVDATTGTIQMKARFDNAAEKLTPGQFLEVSMTLRTVDDALLIPGEAMQSGPDGNFVYVARPDQTVEVRKVQAMPADPRRLVVVKGLAAGENVVTDGQVRLTPGARYEAREAGKPQAPKREAKIEARDDPGGAPRGKGEAKGN